MKESTTGIEVHVVAWNDGRTPEVALHFKDLDQLITLTAEAARSLAFCLVECSDFIQPPFATVEQPTETSFYPDSDDEEIY